MGKCGVKGEIWGKQEGTTRKTVGIVGKPCRKQEDIKRSREKIGTTSDDLWFLLFVLAEFKSYLAYSRQLGFEVYF